MGGGRTGWGWGWVREEGLDRDRTYSTACVRKWKTMKGEVKMRQ